MASSKLHNNKAEQSVLAGIINGILPLEDANQYLSQEYFTIDKNREIYKILNRLHQNNMPLDMVNVFNQFNDYDYLSKLVSNISPTGIYNHLEVIQSLGIRRQLQSESRKIFQTAEDKEKSVNEIIDESQNSLFQLTVNSSEAIHIGEVLHKIYDKIEAHQPCIEPGIPTQYVDLDTILSGFHRSNLTILAARPRMGKSALAGNFSTNIAKAGYGNAVFSLEMDKEQWLYRSLSAEAWIDYQRLKNGDFNTEDYKKLTEAASRLFELPIYIDDAPGLSLFEIKSRARKLVQKQEVACIFIDYLTKIKPSEKRETRDQEVTDIASGLKDLAKELHIPIVCLAQLNRKCEERKDSRPILSDLRESGGIEQEADDILFLYRDEVYNPRNDNPNKGIAEIKVAKQRNGPEGMAQLAWFGSYQSFKNLQKEGKL